MLEERKVCCFVGWLDLRENIGIDLFWIVNADRLGNDANPYPGSFREFTWLHAAPQIFLLLCCISAVLFILYQIYFITFVKLFNIVIMQYHYKWKRSAIFDLR
jgi:hypothetical protein